MLLCGRSSDGRREEGAPASGLGPLPMEQAEVGQQPQDCPRHHLDSCRQHLSLGYL